MRPRLALLLVVALVAAVAVGCGGGEETAPLPETGATVGADTGGAATEPADTGGTDTAGTETGGTDTGGTDTTGTGTGGGEGDAGAGKEVFASAGCGSCHTLADAGSSGAVGPNLDEAKPDQALVVDRVTNGAGAMPSFKDQLSEQQIQDVAAYVSSVAGA